MAGVFFGFLRVWTGSVWPVAIAHAVYNFIWGEFARNTLWRKGEQSGHVQRVQEGGQVMFVPNVLGLPLAEAQSRLALEGLQIGAIEEAFDEEAPEGRTIPIGRPSSA